MTIQDHELSKYNLRPNPNQTKEAFREWLSRSIAGIDKSRVEAGRFFFTASASAIAVVVAISELFENVIAEPEYFSFGFLLMSAMVAISLTFPYRFDFRTEDDVQVQHEDLIRRTSIRSLVWATLWFLGVFAALVGVAYS